MRGDKSEILSFNNGNGWNRLWGVTERGIDIWKLICREGKKKPVEKGCGEGNLGQDFPYNSMMGGLAS